MRLKRKYETWVKQKSREEKTKKKIKFVMSMIGEKTSEPESLKGARENLMVKMDVEKTAESNVIAFIGKEF